MRIEKTKDAKSPTAILVEWEDSVQVDPSWQWVDEIDHVPVATCQSVGWLLHRDERQITLAVSIGTSRDRLQASGVITIPVRAIIKLTCLSSGPASSIPSTGLSCPDAA